MILNHVAQWTSDSLFPLRPQFFEILVCFSRQAPSISLDKMIAGRYILKVWIFLWGNWYHFWYALLTTINIALIQKRLWISDLCNSYPSYGNDEAWTWNLLIPKKNLTAKVLEFEFHHYHDSRIQ